MSMIATRYNYQYSQVQSNNYNYCMYNHDWITPSFMMFLLMLYDDSHRVFGPDDRWWLNLLGYFGLAGPIAFFFVMVASVLRKCRSREIPFLETHEKKMEIFFSEKREGGRKGIKRKSLIKAKSARSRLEDLTQGDKSIENCYLGS